MPYIEKLELKGFKSYGNRKVVIPFSKGFTAIVGANGSGKSNIGDAILFVLGGLSAKAMRATRISDLIFAGSKGEPPAKYAEVAIYFNNEDRGFPIDEDEVVIKRRVYPDGRSAYWLNGRRATRSEILDLLSAAMISPEGYNLVLQGDITKFIKMSPLERRQLIDEISGIAEYDAKKEKALEELKQAEENLARVDLLIKEVKKQLDKLEKERNDALRYLDLKERLERARVALLLGEIKRLESMIDEGERKRAEIESGGSENTIKVKSAQLRIQLEEKRRELKHFDAALIRSVKEVSLDLEVLRKEIEDMEAEIKALEPVNMKAIEDFEVVERRYLELKSKREKLEAEKESIIEFINEIEKEKKNVFMRTLEAIAKNFSELFAKLSPGGSARLILENPEDPFSGGLEIEAKPAGKDVKRIEAMSGGEKALTALAFIFAIQRFKPAPFYLFDEIDAHLDDANVKRVADLIKESSRESQFIVITLRDVMMANADKIIGVSMRDGVSRVVSLSLEKAMKILEEAKKRNEATIGGVDAGSSSRPGL
uniref:Chromosome partition protein Smc n=1 Tax=Pyrococcus yayanosii (strain CH1 / JCM 16557) TaxID=529709 RepID=UPI000B3D7B92|nr:Chain A, Chromosome partition protein Smc [Pyrococcus yayanosii CH1]